jgi:FG-GAP repeat
MNLMRSARAGERRRSPWFCLAVRRGDGPPAPRERVQVTAARPAVEVRVAAEAQAPIAPLAGTTVARYRSVAMLRQSVPRVLAMLLCSGLCWGCGGSSGNAETSPPDGSLPDGSVPEGSTPDGTLPDGTSPDGSGISPPSCQALEPSDARALGIFGDALALEGTTAVVASPGLGDTNLLGEAFVFELVGSTWVERQVLSALNPSIDAAFGAPLGLSGDTLFAGTGEYWDKGTVEVYTRGSDGFVRTQVLAASDGTPSDQFGRALVVSGDLAVVGAPWADGDAPNTGAAYVFTRNGGSWVQTQKLVPSDGSLAANFGHFVALDGDTLLVSEPWANSGAVHVFTRSGSSFAETALVEPASGSPWEGFGYSLALRNDTAMIADANGVFVYELDGSAWKQTQTLSLDTAPQAMALDGQTALLGSSSGAFLSRIVNGKWSAPELIHPFGMALAQSGGLVLAGDSNSHRDGEMSGAADALSIADCNGATGVKACACAEPAPKPCASPQPVPDPSGGCPQGYWLYSDEECGIDGDPCYPTGDGNCHKTCYGNLDCTDPCRPYCVRQELFNGGDACGGLGPLICSDTLETSCS